MSVKLIRNKIWIFISFSLTVSLLVFIVLKEEKALIIQNVAFAFLLFVVAAIYFGGAFRILYKLFRFNKFRIYIKCLLVLNGIIIVFSTLCIGVLDPAQMFISTWAIIGTFTGISITCKWVKRKLNLKEF